MESNPKAREARISPEKDPVTVPVIQYLGLASSVQRRLTLSSGLAMTMHLR
jgi:hypothetical protein